MCVIPLLKDLLISCVRKLITGISYSIVNIVIKIEEPKLIKVQLLEILDEMLRTYLDLNGLHIINISVNATVEVLIVVYFNLLLKYFRSIFDAIESRQINPNDISSSNGI